MTATQKQIDELRSLFHQKLESGISNLPTGPHPNDLERAKDDNWLRKFINHHECDVNEALNMMIDTMVWRKQNAVNELNESKINMDYMKEGLFFPRGKDIDNCTILIFNSKKHVKGQRDADELKKCVVYWFERLDKIDKCERISVLFDMADTGLSNMDMDFIKYLITLLKLYYPDFLNYILIYEMPWVLSAAFKVIKALLPAAAVAKMKNITKSNVTDFVPIEQAQASWGGKDQYTYTFVPEPGLGSSQQVTEKKVTFSDPGSPVQENKQLPSSDGETHKIILSPNDCVNFTSDGKDINGSFIVTNNSSGYISYKIKTTSPEKFRVRPSMGILAPGSSQNIGLLLLEGYQNSAAGREKFLVTCVTVDKQELTPKELAEMWKDTSKLNIEQHKLRCAYPVKKANGMMSSTPTSNQAANGHTADFDNNARDIDKITNLVRSLKSNQESLDKNLKTLKTIQLLNLLLTALLLCLIIYLFGSSNAGASSASASSGEFCSST